jgi:uncharacterized protein YdeI (YjbR/CyaY-like superfamily)
MRIQNPSRLKRPIYPMPDFVRQALVKRKLMDAYHNRPPYQQNDYISWITRAKQAATEQMLDELVRGDSYMGMVWRPKRLMK